jgi:hypothetical protein
MNRAARASIAAVALPASLVAPALTLERAGAEPAPAGNTVLAWDEIAANAIVVNAEQSAHPSMISYAMVQGAVYDAVNAIDGGFSPYLDTPAADPSLSQEAAAAAAAFGVLAGLFPDQLNDLQAAYDDSLATVADGAAKTGGIEVGEAAAAAMLAARADDGRGGDFRFVAGSEPGEWRTDPPANLEDPAAWVAMVDPFLVPDVAELRTDGPLDLASEAYAADFNEVKELGSLTSTTRTADQTEAAIFWQGHPSAMWHSVFRQLAVDHGLDVADSARLLAMASLASAEGAIACWNDKAYWSFWRPVTAIREAADDGNPATEPDPEWLPLFDESTPVEAGTPLATPGFPDHPSGHGCTSGSVVYTLQNFFGTDDIEVTFASPRTGTTRTFDTLSAVIDEIIEARIWGGIHFRTADVQGAQLGEGVADYLAANYFRPTSVDCHILCVPGRGG